MIPQPRGTVATLGLAFSMSASLVAQSDHTGRVSRRVVEARLIETALPASGPLLDRAFSVRALAGNLVVADFGSSSIKAFRPTGTLRWQVGREGSGPGEFRGPSSLALLRSGHVVVADPRLGRVTSLTSDGRVDAAHSMGRQIHRVFPFRGDTVLATAIGDSLFVKYVGSNRVGFLPLPNTLQFLNSTHVVRDYLFAQSSSGDVALVFIYPGLVGLFRSDRVNLELASGPATAAWPVEDAAEVRMPDGRKAVRRGLDPRIRPNLVGVAVEGSFVYALTYASEGAAQFIDVFRRQPLRYVCSVPVTGRVQDFAVLDGALYLLRLDPEPLISRLAPTVAADLTRALDAQCPER